MLTNIQTDNLIELLRTDSPSGQENQVCDYIKKRLQNSCNVYTDVIGNTYMQTGNEDGLKIMITSHCDEVSFQVTKIDENGFVNIRKVASPDRQTIAGEKVVLVGKGIKCVGVIGKKSPHVMQKEEAKEVPEVANLWVDFGFTSYSEANNIVNIGDYLVPYSEPMISFNKTKVISKALDNKISIFILTELMDLLAKEDLSVSVTGIATVQEELGCRGAIVASHRISPDVAFCLDVGIATDIPSMSTITEFGHLKLGAGPGININPENNPYLTTLLNNVAKDGKICVQNTIGYRPVHGTETGHIQLSNIGVATALISIPNRYMHSPVEMCDTTDVCNAIQLLFNSIKKMQELKKLSLIPW